MRGRTCRLEPLDVDRHGEDLVRALFDESRLEQWTYLPYGPFEDRAELRDWLREHERLDDPRFFAILESNAAAGLAAFMRLAPEHGALEVGHIHFSPRLQRTVAATEAMFLMMRTAFELGYRRYEWKCDSWNLPSARAAERLGFRFEGIFRQHLIYKGRSRDTAWFSITDADWPRLEKGFEAWLDPSNFDAAGKQRERLQDLFPSQP